MSPKDLRVAIVGGGICGLTCAVGLAKQGISVQIYEAAAKFGEVGAGVGIGPNAVRILRELGVLDDVLSRAEDTGCNISMFRFISGMEGHEWIYDYPAGPEDESRGVHRAAYLDALVSHIDPKMAHFNKRCTSISASTDGHNIIHFSDGSTADADIILGADGLKSAVRGVVTGTATSSVKFSGGICYRGLVPTTEMRAAGVKLDLDTRPACFVGKNKHLIVFPIRGGQIINVVAFVTNRDVPIGEAVLPPGEATVVSVPQKEVLDAYEGWGSDVLGLLGCIHNPTKWNINVVYPHLETYVNGRIALLGDAAHGMMTHLGAGAGQGLEDVYLLVKLISHPQTASYNIETVLQVYDEVRRPRSQNVWEQTLQAGDVYEGCGPHGYSFEGLRQDLTGIWDYVWGHGVEDDVRDAVRRLENLGVYHSM